MCRILAVRADRPIDVLPFLAPFAERCRVSHEFQGHGWGVSWREDGAWRTHRTLVPIWDGPFPELPRSTLFLVHARSAFRDELIAVENNMPFVEDGIAFAFNGELRGVRLRVPGETGAWRLFHLLRRFAAADEAGGPAALRRLDAVVAARTEYVRAMNVVASDGEGLWLSTRWSESPDYFTLWRARLVRATGDVTLVSSERFTLADGDEPEWMSIPNESTADLSEGATCCS